MRRVEMPIIFKTNACGLCEDKPHMERTTVTRREAIKGAAALALASASDAQAEMRGFESHNRLFARYILPNAQLEELATGFRWIEGPVWMGDAGCLLFQDLPNNRTMAIFQTKTAKMNTTSTMPGTTATMRKNRVESE